VEVRALEVGHVLKALLPNGVLLILNQEKRERQYCCSSEAVLAQGGEGDVRHHLDAGVGFAANDRPQSRLHGVKSIVALISYLSKPWAIDSQQW
jgi:hypothetical protein